MKTQLIHTIARFNANPNATKTVAVVMLLVLAAMALLIPGTVVLADIPITGGG